jgi:hypothetical protein
MIAFLEQSRIWLFEDFEEISLQFDNIVAAVSFDFGCLLLNVDFLNDRVFPLSVFENEAFGQFANITGRQQISAERISVDFLLFISQHCQFFLESNIDIFLHGLKFFLFILFGLLERDE